MAAALISAALPPLRGLARPVAAAAAAASTASARRGLGRPGQRFASVLASPPPAVYCIGLNYKKHAAETGKEEPRFPIYFFKPPTAIIGPGDAIEIPSVVRADEVDFEAELVVIIGKAAKNVAVENALEYVQGYTVGNDISARRWQGKKGGTQWCRSKAFDTFCPLGPKVVPASEIPDPNNLAISSSINGEVMQQSNTKDMIFSVAQLIAFLSEDTTLLPGTIILTGTPEGVGYTRKPPVCLKPGDTLTTSIEKIGDLTNPVKAASQ